MQQGERPQSQSQPETFLRVCQDCDLVQAVPKLRDNEAAHCLRCHSVLETRKKNSLNRSLALVLTGIILFILSNLFPLLSLKAQGIAYDGTLLSASIELYNRDRPWLALLVLFTTFIFPAISLLGTLFVLIVTKLHYQTPVTASLFRFLHSTEIWGMLEVFMLAILVAGVKLGDLADIIMGVSLYSFICLIIVLSFLSLSLNSNTIWHPDGHHP
ncbi:MAG TPA: paraquat-inducible protein A [Thiothrix sp.]|nr:paraquat-inducible protein A [Thiothrix sp.]